MSYGIIRVQKFKAAAVTGIQIHDKREKEKSNTNPDIDYSKSNQNYSLIEADERPFQTQIKEKIESLNLKKAVRKDAVVMCQILVTSNKDFFDNITPEQEKQFFQDSLEFIKKRYGADNIISAEVHKDEKTPHLHINLVPINDNKLSAKSLFDRPFLYKLQDDFYNDVSKNYGLERGGQEEHQRHKTMQELKKETLKKEDERLHQLEQDIQSKMEHYSKNDVKIERLTADEVKPQKSGFLNMYSETDAGVALRLNKKLENTFKLAEIAKQALNKIKELSKTIEILQKSLKDFKDRFNGLSKEQEQAIFKQIDRFKYENTIKRENQLKTKNMNSQRHLER